MVNAGCNVEELPLVLLCVLIQLVQAVPANSYESKYGKQGKPLRHKCIEKYARQIISVSLQLCSSELPIDVLTCNRRYCIYEPLAFSFPIYLQEMWLSRAMETARKHLKNP